MLFLHKATADTGIDANLHLAGLASICRDQVRAQKIPQAKQGGGWLSIRKS
jgi:hypothetical protein